ncbi:MAG: HEAT repeat domain-containing protein, partial [Candidatus Thorarchaeota archaeon]
EDTDVQRSSIRALAKLGDKRAVEPLVHTLLAPDRYVRQDAADALALLGWEPSSSEERSWGLLAKEEWAELIAMGDLAIETILTALSDSDDYHRGKILQPLSEANVQFSDPRLVDAIMKIYKDPEQADYRRRDASDALRCVPIPKVVKFLLREYLKTPRRYTLVGIEDTLEHLVTSDVDVGGTLITILKRMKMESFSKGKLEACAKLFSRVPFSHKDIKAIRPKLESIDKRKMDDNTKDYISFLIRLDELITELAEGDIPTREKAAEEMGDIQFPSASVPLVKALEDSYPVVRQKAATALGNLGKGAIPALLSALESEDYRVRMGAAEALGHIGDACVGEQLLKRLKDKHQLVRQNTAWALGELILGYKKYEAITKKIIRALTKAMRSDYYFPVRFNAVYALTKVYSKHATKPLLEAADNPAVEIRLNATYGFIKLAQILREPSSLQRQVIDKLIEALSDDEARVRYNAVDGLRLFGGEKALAALTALQDDGDPEMHKLVERGIEEIKSMIGRKRSSWSYSTRVHYELRDPEVIEELIQLLGHEDEDVQRSAQKELGKFKQLAFDRLMEILQDKEEYWLIREGAAGALGRIKDKRAVDTLLVTLKDDHEMIRCNSAWSLAELKVKRTLKALIEATKDEFWMVRLNAAAGIGKIGGKRALDRLLEMVEDEHPKVREIVASYIAQFKDERVMPALRGMLKDSDSTVRKMVKSWIKELEKKKSKSKKKN